MLTKPTQLSGGLGMGPVAPVFDILHSASLFQSSTLSAGVRRSAII